MMGLYIEQLCQFIIRYLRRSNIQDMVNESLKCSLVFDLVPLYDVVIDNLAHQGVDVPSHIRFSKKFREAANFQVFEITKH